MSEPFLGQVTIFAGNFAPRGWAFCDGQLLPISQYSALFSILGTTYGGDGRTTFALPDLRGRTPIGPRNGPGLSDYRLGQQGGSQTNTLTVSEMPSHNHSASLQTYGKAGALGDPVGLVNGPVDTSAPINTSATVGNTGGNQPVNNLQPYLAINYIIALQGIFPSRS
ncbi:MAG: phage tail protein [Alphaproteobacteria bacterium]|nr:phage tail protein [Alphaproteobacteria bacterium]MCB9792335.1 phage tail protein [Alphaproteobacteria bacterium]